MLENTYKSPLHTTAREYPTHFWNDSYSGEELAYAIEHGAVAATSSWSGPFGEEFMLLNPYVG